MKDNLKLVGKVRVEHKSPRFESNIVETRNTVVTIGKAQIAKNIVSGAYASDDPMGWMSIGLGSATITAADTTIGSEYLKFGPGSVTGSTTTTATTNDTAQWIGSFGIDATKVVNEAGLFNASGLNTGTMLSRANFANKSAISGDQINITWTVDLS